MNVSTLKVSVPEAMSVEVTEDTLTAELSDGRTVSVPLSWYPSSFMPRRRNARTGGSSAPAMVSTGPPWMRISAWKCCWVAGLREKTRAPSNAGWKQSGQDFP